MAETIWESGRLTHVWSPAGRTAGGMPRFRRAPFDILTWSSVDGSPPDTYVTPLSIERMNSAEVALKGDGSAQLGHEYGYYSSDSMVIETHQGDGLSDTLQSLHAFGPI